MFSYVQMDFFIFQFVPINLLLGNIDKSLASSSLFSHIRYLDTWIRFLLSLLFSRILPANPLWTLHWIHSNMPMSLLHCGAQARMQNSNHVLTRAEQEKIQFTQLSDDTLPSGAQDVVGCLCFVGTLLFHDQYVHAQVFFLQICSPGSHLPDCAVAWGYSSPHAGLHNSLYLGYSRVSRTFLIDAVDV